MSYQTCEITPVSGIDEKLSLEILKPRTCFGHTLKGPEYTFDGRGVVRITYPGT